MARHSGKCVDVSSASTEDGAAVVQWGCHGGNNQRFYVQDWGGRYRLVAKHSGKCLDVSGASTADGAYFIQWPCHGGDNQTFYLR
ncbi:RICIN domain-containing protein [Cystobacter fuscus]